MKEFTVVAFYRTGRFIKKWNRVEQVIEEVDKDSAVDLMVHFMRRVHPQSVWFIAQAYEEETDKEE